MQGILEITDRATLLRALKVKVTLYSAPYFQSSLLICTPASIGLLITCQWMCNAPDTSIYIFGCTVQGFD